MKETKVIAETEDSTRDWSELEVIMPQFKNGASTKEIATNLNIPELLVLMVIGYNK